MKKFFLLIVLFLVANVYSQNRLIGLKTIQAENSKIFELNNNILTITHEFIDKGVPCDNLVEVNNQIFGSVKYRVGGTQFQSIVKYNLSDHSRTLIYNVRYPTIEIKNIKAGTNNLYAVQGNFMSRYIVSINSTTGATTSLFSIDNDFVDYINETDNKIYYITKENYTGKLYSYDIATGTLSTEHVFETATGTWPTSLLLHSNGKIYGVTASGGASGVGVIFEFDPVNGNYQKIYDLNRTNQALTLTEGDNNKVYGFVAPNNQGRLFEFDIVSHQFNNLHSFSINYTDYHFIYQYINAIYFNHKVIGIYQSRNHGQAEVFSYDLINNTFNSIETPYVFCYSKLLKTHDNQLLFQTDIVNENTYGAMYQLDPVSNQISNTGIEFGNKGTIAKSHILASNGMIYGITNEGLMDKDYGSRLYSYNFETQEYTQLINFHNPANGDLGEYPSQIEQGTNGKIYLSMGTIGKILEYDPNTHSYRIVINLNDQYAPPSLFNSIVFFENNGIIYGFKHMDNVNKGRFFSYNINTSTYNTLFESQDISFMSILGYSEARNIFYGKTMLGGAYNNGVIFTYDPNNNQYNVVYDVNSDEKIDLTHTVNGDIYFSRYLYQSGNGSYILYNSNSENGSIVKINNDNSTTTVLQFDTTNKTTYGGMPRSIFSVENELYITTFGVQDQSNKVRELLLIYNPANNTGRIATDIWMYATWSQPDCIHNQFYVLQDNSVIGGSDKNGGVHFKINSQGTNTEMLNNFSSKIFNILDVTGMTVSINDTVQNNDDISVYPNPATNIIYFTENIKDVEIFTLSGQQINTKLQNHSIDISNLKKGIYLLKMRDVNHKLSSKKLIVIPVR